MNYSTDNCVNSLPTEYLTKISLPPFRSTFEVNEAIQQLNKAIQVLNAKLEMAPTTDHDTGGVTENSPDIAALEIAEMLLRLRRKIERHFGIGLFSQPVWGILLDLYVARSKGCDVSVGNACIASSVPMTSALRFCQLLHDRGIVVRERDRRDGRRVLLRLSDRTFLSMTKLFLSCDTNKRFESVSNSTS
jgi:hypothetical protein